MKYKKNEGAKIGRIERIWYEGACYHVMARGVRRQEIFKEKEDYEIMLMILQKTQEQIPFELNCYCLMTNHIHMILTTRDMEIGKIMKRFLAAYARNFNAKYHYSGHLFESRFVSRIIEDDVYFLEASRYIHLNPVKAGMVNEPVVYPYSSYRSYMETGSEGNSLLDRSRVMNCFRYDPVERYRKFVEDGVTHGEQEKLIQTEIGENDLWLPW